MKLVNFAFSTIFASISSLTLVPAASAITWFVSGAFDDLGSVSGTFDFDEMGNYSNVDLSTTPVDALMTEDNKYNDSDLSSGFSNDLGLTLETADFSFLLNLAFESSLAGVSSPTTINLLSSSAENYNFLAESRQITSGTVSTSVPFEFSPSLGIFLVAGTWIFYCLRIKSNSSINND